MKIIAFLILILFQTHVVAMSTLTAKANVLEIGMSHADVLYVLGEPTWAVIEGDKGEFMLESEQGLVLRWNNTPYNPVVVVFDKNMKVSGLDKGQTENETMAMLIARGLADYSCEKKDRQKYCIKTN